MKTRKADDFFAYLDSQFLAVTFDDVRLRTAYSAADFNQASLESWFSSRVPLKVPVVSAAMDRVTEREMAIGLASLGGLGVIHRNLDPDKQSQEVRAVKLHLNGKVQTPITVRENQTVHEVLALCAEKGYSFRSFPVLGAEERLVGVLSGNDIDRRQTDSDLVSQLMTPEVVHGTVEMSTDQAFALMNQHRIKVLPLVDDALKVKGMYVLSDLQRIRNKAAHHNTDEQGQLLVGAAVGTGEDAKQRVPLLVRRGVDVIVIDSAHGDSVQVLETVKWIIREYPSVDVVAGNISEYDAAKNLMRAGVNGMKVGQGGGSICTTRIMAGIGTPQVTAVYNCCKAVRETGSMVPVCADGGIRFPGDITIAMAAGADSVMLGMVLAGTDESPGEKISRGNGFVKEYRGMGSLSAMRENAASRERYGELQTNKKLILAEGVEGFVPYTGSLAEVLHRNLEGLRRGMGYAGVTSIEELHEQARFIRCSPAGMVESRPHDILEK